MYPLTFLILQCEGMCVLLLYLQCLLSGPFWLLTNEQTNGSEFNANRVEMRTTQHLSSIRQENSGLSLEREEGGGIRSYGSFRLWMPAAGWYNGNIYLNTLDMARDPTGDSMSARKLPPIQIHSMTKRKTSRQPYEKTCNIQFKHIKRGLLKDCESPTFPCNMTCFSTFCLEEWIHNYTYICSNKLIQGLS